ncbi:MAG: TetR/AcrR family transcriptional regulator, partial [Acidimicrobiia bacterium]
ELFAAAGPSHVSVRQIAARAGVNHGLVHYYFGSKDALLAAVLDACADAVARELDRADDVTSLMQPGSAVARHARILAHVILDAGDPAAIQHDFPAQRLLVDRFGARGHSKAEARARAAQVSALVLGWELFGGFLATASGLPATATQRAAGLDDAIRRLIS